MTFLKEFGRGAAYNTHNITSLIRTLKHVSDILQTGEAFTVEEYKHTHKHTHTHTSHTHGSIKNNNTVRNLSKTFCTEELVF